MKFSIMLEGQQGLTWPRWQKIAALVDELGFAGLFRSDHFTDPAPPSRDSLELVVSLAYLASHTKQIHFGPCVAPVSFRDPIMFARQAAAIDDLSGGRMILGLGAGWQEREHTMFGYPLGDVATRMARYEEALEVVSLLLRGSEPASFTGRFYNLKEAELLPRAQRPGGTQIMIGGNGPKRTLPLAARYANIWNGVFLTPEEFRERTNALDDLLRAAGRAPESLQRTLMTVIHYGQDRAALDQKLAWRHIRPEFAGKSLDQTIAQIREGRKQIVGTPDDVIPQLREYADAGVEEFFLQWLDLDDLDGLRSIAQHILPQFI
ncbi:MAG: TIGR03560 family F420-dependent LLM class oxidoreductase [Roseiflexaceae bacterium]|nr:TIGR03560 family F420-dependent LLM class oxidoreductase [Roseiflexaceae bacterium]